MYAREQRPRIKVLQGREMHMGKTDDEIVTVTYVATVVNIGNAAVTIDEIAWENRSPHFWIPVNDDLENTDRPIMPLRLEGNGHVTWKTNESSLEEIPSDGDIRVRVSCFGLRRRWWRKTHWSDAQIILYSPWEKRSEHGLTARERRARGAVLPLLTDRPSGQLHLW